MGLRETGASLHAPTYKQDRKTDSEREREMESSTNNPAGSLQPFLIWLFYPVPVVNAICVESQGNFLQTNTHILRSEQPPCLQISGFLESFWN